MDDILETELDMGDLEAKIPEFVPVKHKLKRGMSEEIDRQTQYVAYVHKYYGGQSKEYNAAVESLKTLCEAQSMSRKEIFQVLNVVVQLIGGGFIANSAIKLIAKYETQGCAFSTKGLSLIVSKLMPFGKIKI